MLGERVRCWLSNQEISRCVGNVSNIQVCRASVRLLCLSLRHAMSTMFTAKLQSESMQLFDVLYLCSYALSPTSPVYGDH